MGAQMAGRRSTAADFTRNPLESGAKMTERLLSTSGSGQQVFACWLLGGSRRAVSIGSGSRRPLGRRQMTPSVGAMSSPAGRRILFCFPDGPSDESSAAKGSRMGVASKFTFAQGHRPADRPPPREGRRRRPLEIWPGAHRKRRKIDRPPGRELPQIAQPSGHLLARPPTHHLGPARSVVCRPFVSDRSAAGVIINCSRRP